MIRISIEELQRTKLLLVTLISWEAKRKEEQHGRR